LDGDLQINLSYTAGGLGSPSKISDEQRYERVRRVLTDYEVRKRAYFTTKWKTTSSFSTGLVWIMFNNQ